MSNTTLNAELVEFKSSVWRKAQAAKQQWGFSDVVDQILAELGITAPAPAAPAIDEYAPGSIVMNPELVTTYSRPLNAFADGDANWHSTADAVIRTWAQVLEQVGAQSGGQAPVVLFTPNA